MRNVVLVSGETSDLKVFGPFKDQFEAVDYADDHLGNEKWWVVALEKPEEA